MMDKLKARKAEIERLREERGATDPILIIAGIAITLILLVGGSFAISGFIGNAHNLNAKGDLDRIATAQAANLAMKDSYAPLRLNIHDGGEDRRLMDSAIPFTPTANNPLIVSSFNTAGKTPGWAAVVKSASGEVFARLSTGSTIYSLGSDPATMATMPAAFTEQASAIGATSWVSAAFARVNGR
jgi:hypothetical protein